MKQKIRALSAVEVVSLDELADTDSITNEINDYIVNMLEKINVSDLEDWNILITLCFKASNKIGASKGGIRYPSDKELATYISIPIPDKSQANYGVEKLDKRSFYNPITDKVFHLLDPNYNEYDCLYDYILTSSKNAIELAFTKGITFNGKKIKIQS